MIIQNGLYASAKIFTDHVENYALAQIQNLCDQPAVKGSQIRVMPDVHPGVGNIIGLTMTATDAILPGIVGVDIGCGITLTKIKAKTMEYQKLDTIIRERIPCGFAIRDSLHHQAEAFDLSSLRCFRHIQEVKSLLSLGTLGGGNHFIEVDRAESGDFYLAVHSGSRHLGKEVAEYYQKTGHHLLKKMGKTVPYPLTYLQDQLLEDYLYDLQIVQDFAAKNREIITWEILKGMKWKPMDCISIPHNYVKFLSKEEFADGSKYLIRKGAISAKSGEKLVIPIHMKDGMILGVGKGNADWNYSAPHGSGRILGRKEVSKHHTVSQFRLEMKGIYCSCIKEGTLDEAPFAYRGLDEIRNAITDTAEVLQILKPVYNFKAAK